MHPTDVHVDDTMRFEGETNPADQDIVFAIQCICGCKGTYSAAYGPATPPRRRRRAATTSPRPTPPRVPATRGQLACPGVSQPVDRPDRTEP